MARIPLRAITASIPGHVRKLQQYYIFVSRGDKSKTVAAPGFSRRFRLYQGAIRVAYEAGETMGTF